MVLEPEAGQAPAARGSGRPVDPGEPPRARRLHARYRPRSGRQQPTLLFCENETNRPRIEGAPSITPYPKDGINDHVIEGAATVNPDGVGTKASPWYRLDVRPGETAEIRLRLHKVPRAAKPRAGSEEAGATTAASAAVTTAAAAVTPAASAQGGNGKAAAEDITPIDPLGPSFESTMRRRESEADDFYAALRREGGTDDEQRILRQAFAGMLWSKQYYGYNVSRWLDGDPGLPPPPPERLTARNSTWRHFDAADVISMPDPWEYPWFAAWDLAFHAVTFAHIDPAFAKYQLLLLCREWFQHPHGALPAYEWSFDDVNPPVHAAAAYLVFTIDGRKDYEFLRRIFHKLLINFTWWLNRQDKEGNDLYSGGFLGLDNIGAFDRSHLPAGTELEQSDATAWMFMYCINMLRIATVLAEHDPTYEDFQTTFMEHAVRISAAMNRSGLWDPVDGFFYDALKLADGTAVPIKVHSMVGIIPLLPVASIPERMVRRGQSLGKRFASFMESEHLTGAGLRDAGRITGRAGHENLQLSVVPPAQLGKMLGEMLSDEGFLSPHGLRALSKRHRDQPFKLELGGLTASVDYEPGESTSGMFGGNSNWRGPVWMPTNYLAIVSLWNWDSFMGDDFRVEYPTGSGVDVRLRDVAEDIARRLVSIWLDDENGRRPVFGAYEKFQTDPDWHDLLWFHEYFHGDTGAGIGASHQTGWTGIVAHLLCQNGIIDAIDSGRSTARMGLKPTTTAAKAKQG